MGEPVRLWVTGQDRVLRKLNSEVAKLNRRSEAGIRAAMLIIEGVAKPVTPLQNIKGRRGGNLRGSWYSKVFRKARGPVGEVGFEAAYAPYVHEMMGTSIGWTTPGTGPKFLENPMKESVGDVLAVLRATLRIK